MLQGSRTLHCSVRRCHGILHAPQRTQAVAGFILHQRAKVRSQSWRGRDKWHLKKVRQRYQFLPEKAELFRRELLVAPTNAWLINLGEGFMLPLRRAAMRDGREQRCHPRLVCGQKCRQRALPLRSTDERRRFLRNIPRC